jgi:hypothetical protein
MNKESYIFIDQNSIKSFDYLFVSVGKNGYITKGVRFVQLYETLYNLILGDYDEKLELLDDMVVSDNGDMPKVIATVFKIINDFLVKNPLNMIYIQANTVLKQKLYTRIIRNNHQDIVNTFNVMGILRTQEAEIFESTKEYIAFLITLK